MAQTIGVVIEINGDGQATVVAEKGQGCGSCSAVSQCQGGRASHSQQTPALNRAGAVVGDRVMLTVESGDILIRLALLYLVPVFGMLTGAFAGAFLFGGVDGTDGGYSVALGLAGFILGFVFSVAVSRFWSATRPVMPVITRVVTNRFAISSNSSSAGCGCGGR